MDDPNAATPEQQIDHDPPPTGGDAGPEEMISALLRRMTRFGAMMQSHSHGGVRVSPSEALALEALTGRALLSQQDLAGLLDLEKSTTSRLVDALERRGWVTREKDASNRRTTRLILTEAGADVAVEVTRDRRRRNRHLLSLLSDEERNALLVALTALERVTRHAKAPPPAP